MSQAKNPVQAVRRTFEIVDVLRTTGGARVTDIANATGISKGTVHCHLATLEENGYATKEGAEYKLGLRFVDLAHHAKNRITIRDVATAEVDALAEDSGEMALFTVEEDGEGVCLYRADGADSIKTEVYVGYRNGLHHTAGGKAMLAFMPASRRDRILEETTFRALTPNTITDEETLREELSRIRKEGVAYNRGETIQGLVGAGAPIRDQDGTILGAISVVGPACRMDDDRLEREILALIHRAANIIQINVTGL